MGKLYKAGDQLHWCMGITERINKGKGWSNPPFLRVESFQNFGQETGKAILDNLNFDVLGQLIFFEFLFKVQVSVLSSFNEGEDHYCLSGKTRGMI